MEVLSPELQKIFASGEVLHPETPGINPLFQRHVAGYHVCEPYCVEKAVLDVGTGEGYGTSHIAKVAKSVQGLEFAHPLVEHANSRYGSKKLSYMQGKAEVLPFEEYTFDTVISLQLIEHLPDYKVFIKEAYRVLKPGGTMVTVTPNKHRMLSGVNPYHFTEFDPPQLGKAMEEFFPHVEVLGLFGSKRYLALKSDEQAFAKKILAIDFLNLRRFVPRSLIRLPYRLAFEAVNKNTDSKEHEVGVEITPDDFFISSDNLKDALEAITICNKPEGSTL